MIIGFAYLFASQSACAWRIAARDGGSRRSADPENEKRNDMQNSSGITDKVVAITGASSGIVEATTLLLAERGAKVILWARGLDRLGLTFTAEFPLQPADAASLVK